MKLKAIVFLHTLLLFFINSYAQDFDWLRTYHGSGVEALISDTSGNTVSLVSETGVTNRYYDSFHFLTAKGTYLVKRNVSGKVTNACKSGSFRGQDICIDKQGSFYVGGAFDNSDTSVYVDSLRFNLSKGGYILAKYDNNLNFKWAIQIGGFNSTCGRIIYSDEHLYFISRGNAGFSIFGSNSYNFGKNDYTDIYGEINSANGQLFWSNYLHSGKNSTFLTVQDILHLKNQLYIASNTFQNSLIINSDTFSGQSGFIVRADTIGKYKQRFEIRSGTTAINCLVTDGENIYFGGWYRDTVLWGNRKIIPEYSSTSKKAELFIASITTSFKTRWFYRPTILDKSNGGKNNYIQRATFCNGYFYFAGAHDTKILVDSNILKTSSYSVLLLKSDYLGNILWAVNGGGKSAVARSVFASNEKYIFAGGIFSDSIKFGKYHDFAGGYNGFLTKISNNFITRGQVKSGPYCAGDTIKIPFTKYGNFDSSNSFIAQLSDEYGNFESGYRELGRLKSNKDGVIQGTLPLFQVASSKLFRIRILSTKPPVQSYYRIDTLRLLIYSRDKANPGSPDTICRGDTVQLNTFGGTKWNWSPNGRMDNSKARQPKVWPQVSTTYQIIIGDSSGCGEIDTGYKQIFVRKSPKAFLDFIDTVVCSDYRLTIPVNFKFGDSTNYSWNWFLVNSPSSYFLLKSGKSINTDTIFYTSSVEIKKSEKLALVLKDGCSNKNDTTFLVISLREPVNITSKFRDTTICYGNNLSFNAMAKGGLKQNYEWQWKDLTSNSELSVKDFLNFIPQQSSKIQLIMNDGCSNLADTTIFEVIVKPALKLTASTSNGNLHDTILCFGQSVILYAIGKGGIQTGYNFDWTLNQTLVSSADSFLFNTANFFSSNGESKTLKVSLRDYCSKYADSIIRTIQVIPASKADFTFGQACSRTQISFTFTGNVAASPVITNFLWRFPNNDSSIAQNPSKLLSQPGKTKVTLSLKSSNSCKDEITKEIEVKQQSKADFDVNDVCEDSLAKFLNSSKDGVTYNWKFGDGKNSNLASPNHLYSINGVTKTYNVTLVAIVPSGCSDSITKAITINANPNSDFSFIINGNQVNYTAEQVNATQYQWNFGDGGTQNTANQKTSYTYTQSQKYTACLKVFNTANCFSETCKEIAITTGILNQTKLSVIKIYPNPNSGSFTIDLGEANKSTKVEIFNQIGQIIYKAEISEASNKLNLSQPEGIYRIRIIDDERIFHQNLVIHHVP